MDSVFPSPTLPQITAPFTELPDRDRFANEHDVMVTSLDASISITDLHTLITLDAVTLTNSSVSVPEQTEKREYPIEDSDGLNAMEDMLRLHPEQVKRNSSNEVDEAKGFVTADSPSGLMLTIP